MSGAWLDHAFRSASARIIAALAVRYRDIELAEEAFAEACVRAAQAWPGGVPNSVDGWLYRTAERCAVDALRKRKVRERHQSEMVEPGQPLGNEMLSDDSLIPDERLRLIFVCCHPAIAPDARAALTLRVVCGLTTLEIARAFLVSEAALAQRLVRAKRKIAEAGVPFEVPGPRLWPERLEAVLSTLEVAYSKAHEDAAATGAHSGYAREMLDLTGTLAKLLPDEPEVLAFAAVVRFAEARRPARVDQSGCMVPISEQDPARWNRELISEGRLYLSHASALASRSIRTIHATVHQAWCLRQNAQESPPWREILSLYDDLLTLMDDDAIIRLNRLVPFAEVHGVTAALAELDQLDAAAFENFLPYFVVRANLLRREGRRKEARQAYDRALALGPTSAEAIWLRQERDR